MMFRRYFIPVLMLLMVASACAPKDELTPVLKINAVPAISNPADGSAIVLEEANADQVVAEFTWSAADFGFQAGVDYALEIDEQGNDFASAVVLAIVNGTSVDDITVGELNSVLLAKGIPDGVPTTMEFRVVATVSDDVDPVASAVISIDITPYKANIVYPQLQVPGSYQGWNPGDGTTVVYSRQSNDKYEGYLYFADANTAYKYTQGGTWDTNWGDDGADGTLDAGGADIVVADPGMYRLSADLTASTHEALKTDWGLIGDATPGGWDNDTDMTYDPVSGNWSITLNLNTGFIKFRANDGWDVNFGDNDGNKSLEYGGADIAIAEAGNYTIELILSVADYTYTVTKN